MKNFIPVRRCHHVEFSNPISVVEMHHNPPGNLLHEGAISNELLVPRLAFFSPSLGSFIIAYGPIWILYLTKSSTWFKPKQKTFSEDKPKDNLVANSGEGEDMNILHPDLFIAFNRNNSIKSQPFGPLKNGIDIHAQ